LIRRRTVKIIADFQRFSEVTKKAQALLNPDESNAVSVEAGCISFHAQSILHIAQSAHLVHRTSLKFVAGVMAFLSGIESLELDLGLFIHSPKYVVFGKL
jgi:hypothetical protein